MIRLSVRLLCMLVIFFLATWGILFHNNNRTIAPPSQNELKTSLENSIQWLLANRTNILLQKNPILWWMLSESAHITGDQRLTKLVDSYLADMPTFSPWQYFFNPNSLAPIRDETLAQLPDYNILFLYGLTCDQKLAELDTIQEQLEIDFCRENHPVSPACVTHQLMGLRFMQRRECGDQQTTATLASQLQDKIENQLIWDPRVVDVYIQRVLMLTDSGASERVEPIWLRNVLKAQNSDGGWDGFQPLIPLGNKYSFGFTAHAVGVKKNHSNLHATAQGVFLLSLLTAD